MTDSDKKLIYDLLTPEAVRERCYELYSKAEANELEYFQLNIENLDAASELVVSEIISNYPSGKVPFHSRWRHFEFEKNNLWETLAKFLSKCSETEIVRRRFDLAFVSVLLDAGAGADWRFTDSQTGLTYGRSEGLAIASIRLIESGVLSDSGKDDPVRVDSSALQRLQSDDLAVAFQVTDANPLVGLNQRADLLNRLGQTINQEGSIFCLNGLSRPGHLYDYLITKQVGGVLEAREILIALLQGIGEIWPDGERISDTAIGDVGYHPSIRRDNITDGIVPFHKLSQWLAYSLIEPLAEAEIKVVNLDALTGLAEYRNGGLFIDTKTISLRKAEQATLTHHPKSSLIVEWRGLTVALLDKLATLVRKQLGQDHETLPLVSVLQGGTWTAGRKVAKQMRPDGRSPLILSSSGTIF